MELSEKGRFDTFTYNTLRHYAMKIAIRVWGPIRDRIKSVDGISLYEHGQLSRLQKVRLSRWGEWRIPFSWTLAGGATTMEREAERLSLLSFLRALKSGVGYLPLANSDPTSNESSVSLPFTCIITALKITRCFHLLNPTKSSCIEKLSSQKRSFLL